jgi:L-asparaginase
MIKIFTTGGSIDKTYSTLASDFLVGEPQIDDILRQANVNLAYEIESLFRKDSLGITDEDRALIRHAVLTSPHRHIIITHGTDTMVNTAQMLMDIPDKVIVLTGAMQPASFKITDASVNVGCAIAAVQILREGVYIAMSGRIFVAGKTRKNMTTNQFEDMP